MRSNKIITWRGKTQPYVAITGRKISAMGLRRWAEKWGIRMEYIQPGKPQQNAYVERLTGPFDTSGCHSITGGT